MLFDVPAELFSNGALQRARRGVSKDPERELTRVRPTALEIDKNFNVVASACTEHDAGDCDRR